MSSVFRFQCALLFQKQLLSSHTTIVSAKRPIGSDDAMAGNGGIEIRLQNRANRTCALGVSCSGCDCTV